MTTNRNAKVIKHFEVKPDDLDRTDDIESNSEKASAEIICLENRLKQASGQDSKTNELLFTFLRGLNERVAALENQTQTQIAK